MKTDLQCRVPRCRREGDIKYLGHWVCDRCYYKHQSDNKPLGSLRAVLGIKGGMVMAKVSKKGVKKVKALTGRKPEKEGTGRGRKGKTSGLRVAQFWVKMMKDNFQEHLTDEKLVSTMNREFPSSTAYEVGDVKAHRGLFNKGKIRFQEKAPKTPLHEYSSKGEELPLWGERSKARKQSKQKNVPDDLKFGSKPVVRVKRVRAAKRSSS